MKLASVFFLLFFVSSAYAEDAKLVCLQKEYLRYTNLRSTYWNLMDAHFKKTNPDLHAEFSYLVSEQKNHIRAREITIIHLVKNHPEELDFEGSLYNLVPKYKYYAQPIYRELRAIPEFSKIYWENESYKKENKMPDYERLKKASAVVLGEGTTNQLRDAKEQAIKKSQAIVATLPCNS
ncbi:MAG: hypothetical protein GY941_17325 [Planctomycetes bacterium]|nr:hypothetical protein [Planctomycetota bacterium]